MDPEVHRLKQENLLLKKEHFELRRHIRQLEAAIRCLGCEELLKTMYDEKGETGGGSVVKYNGDRPSPLVVPRG
jgi:hypothetical protein